VLSIWEAGYFRPKRTFLVMNEGVIREGRTTAGAFDRTPSDPGVAGMIAAGAVPVMMKRLACMDLVRKSGLGFYGAAAGAKGATGRPLDPT